jgi:hypothetical protein
MTYNFAGRKWSVDDLSELSTLWARRVVVEEISDRLGRTIHSVRHKASDLGLTKRIYGKRQCRPISEIEIPAWVPEIYHSSYAAIASYEDEFEAATFARDSIAVDKIMTRIGIAP